MPIIFCHVVNTLYFCLLHPLDITASYAPQHPTLVYQ